jgi:microcompartment protein CcmL/EutN
MPTAARAKLDGLFIDAIGLIQANVSNILYFADIAQKAAAVFPVELNGSCPQHIITLALLGDIAAVDAAMDAIDLTLKSSNSAHNN